MGRFMRAALQLFVVGAWIFVAAPQVKAQSFSFGFSSGGPRHMHWHDPCWGPPRYRPWVGVVYAAPPPVIHERVIYVEPPPRVSTTIVTPAVPMASNVWTSPVASTAGAANSLASTPVAAAREVRISIRNAAGVKLPVAFLLDGQDVEIPDGESRSFVGQDRRTVQYDRGGRFGTTQHDLTAGEYEFRVTASGWDLVRRPDLPDRTAVRPNALPDVR